MKDGQSNYTTTQWRNNMKLYKLVNVLGAISDTGKLASDMYELGKKDTTQKHINKRYLYQKWIFNIWLGHF